MKIAFLKFDSFKFRIAENTAQLVLSCFLLGWIRGFWKEKVLLGVNFNWGEYVHFLKSFARNLFLSRFIVCRENSSSRIFKRFNELFTPVFLLLPLCYVDEQILGHNCSIFWKVLIHFLDILIYAFDTFEFSFIEKVLYVSLLFRY